MSALHPKEENNDSTTTRLKGWVAGRLARQNGKKPKTWRKVAIFKLDRLGDFVLALGAIRLITQQYGEENCTLIISPHAAEIAAAEFPRASRVVLPDYAEHVLLDWWRLRRAHGWFFETTGFEILINLRHWMAPHHRVVLSWIKRRTTYSLGRQYPNGTNPLTVGHELAHDFPSESSALLCRELLAHQFVVGAALGRPVQEQEILPRFESMATERGDYLFVCPFGSATIRDYPEDALVEAVSAAHTKVSDRVVYSSIPSARPRLERIAARIGAPRSELQTNTSMLEFIRLVAGARCIITMETGTAHIAAALDKPAVILLGGGHHGIFGPWGNQRIQQWLTHPLSCFGCGWSCILPDNQCLNRIEPSRIVQSLRAVSTS